jgi:GTP-binding protein
MEAFFSNAGHMTLGVMIVDARHKPTGDDVTMAEWFKSSARPLVVLANKIDKVKSSAKEQSIELIRETLGFGESTRVIPFSAEKGTNRELLLSEIEYAVKEWYNV